MTSLKNISALDIENCGIVKNIVEYGLKFEMPSAIYIEIRCNNQCCMKSERYNNVLDFFLIQKCHFDSSVQLKASCNILFLRLKHHIPFLFSIAFNIVIYMVPTKWDSLCPPKKLSLMDILNRLEKQLKCLPLSLNDNFINVQLSYLTYSEILYTGYELCYTI